MVIIPSERLAVIFSTSTLLSKGRLCQNLTHRTCHRVSLREHRLFEVCVRPVPDGRSSWMASLQEPRRRAETSSRPRRYCIYRDGEELGFEEQGIQRGGRRRERVSLS